MSKSLFFALVMLLATFLSAYAEDSVDKKFTLGAGAIYGFFTYDTVVRATHAPGASITLDYALDTRSSLFLNYTHQTTSYGNDDRITSHFASLGYKYWLTDKQNWRPWVQVAGGYVWNRSHFGYDFGGSHYDFDYSNGNAQFSFGGGVRYDLGGNFGATASAVLFKEGAPWQWRYERKLLSTSIGLEYNF